MLRVRQQLKIFYTIVGFVAISMVHIFSFLEFSSQMLFHKVTMLHGIFSVHSDASVAANIDPACGYFGTICPVAFAIAKTFGIPHKTRELGDGFSACGADSGCTRTRFHAVNLARKE
jgi:hypothetical protein